MSNLEKLTKKELMEKLCKAVEIIQNQQKDFKNFKNQYEDLINIFENNYQGTFSACNWIEDELLILSWQCKEELAISPKTHQDWFYGLFENTVNLIKSKEYFTVTVNDSVKIGNARGATYFVDVDWNKVNDAKRIHLNNKDKTLFIPIEKQDNRYVRDEELEELNQFMYSLTGKSIEY